ncbi:MAG: HNH endonuclease, partial [Bacillota bacterium]
PNYRGGRSYHSTRISRERRCRIKARDGFRCVHCGRAGKELDAGNGVQLDVHHVVAVRDGGPDDDANLVALCRRCHNRIEHGREELIWPRLAP